MLRLAAIAVMALSAAGAAQAETQAERNGLGGLMQRQQSVREILGHEPYVATPTPMTPRRNYAPSVEQQQMDDLRYRLDRLENDAARRRNWWN